MSRPPSTDALRATPPDTGWRAPHAAPFPGDPTGAPMAWGEQCADQADGFASRDDDTPSPDLDDERGYGHGV
jgi:hypothetical protein